MQGNFDYMPKDEVKDNIKNIQLSVDRLAVNIEHHDKILLNMNEILVSQATNSEKITQSVTKITEIQSEFKEAQRENNEKFDTISKQFNRMTIRTICLMGLILFIAHELEIQIPNLF